MVSAHLQKILFNAIINRPEYLAQSEDRYFEDQHLKRLFPVVKEFIQKYRTVPTVHQTVEALKIKGIEDVPASVVETALSVNLREYDDKWLQENAETFIEYRSLWQSTSDLVNYIKLTKVNAENIKEVVSNAKSLILEKNNVDFSFKLGSDFSDPEAHKYQSHLTFSSGYQFIDTVTDGGFSAKTLSVFVGPPKVGKSLWLGNIAAKAMLDGHNVAVVTLEMSENMYIRRIGSNILSIAMAEYKERSKDALFLKEKIGMLGMDTFKSPGNLTVKEFGTSTASVQDVEAYLRRVEEVKGIKFKVVVIDYLNIMKNWRNANTENTYMKIKQIAEDVRAMAIANDWAVISATQAKQSYFESNDMNMSAASESSALVATVDLMFGIIQDPGLLANKQYRLKVLANRAEGFKGASKLFNVNYNYMRIMEDTTTGISEDAYMN